MGGGRTGCPNGSKSHEILYFRKCSKIHFQEMNVGLCWWLGVITQAVWDFRGLTWKSAGVKYLTNSVFAIAPWAQRNHTSSSFFTMQCIHSFLGINLASFNQKICFSTYVLDVFVCFPYGHMGICPTVGKSRIYNVVKWPYWAIMEWESVWDLWIYLPCISSVPPTPHLAGRDFLPTKSIPGSREDSHQGPNPSCAPRTTTPALNSLELQCKYAPPWEHSKPANALCQHPNTLEL